MALILESQEWACILSELFNHSVFQFPFLQGGKPALPTSQSCKSETKGFRPSARADAGIATQVFLITVTCKLNKVMLGILILQYHSKGYPNKTKAYLGTG